MKKIVLVHAAMLLLAAFTARADAPNAAEAFNRMKTLAGTWNGKLGEMAFNVNYQVIGAGTTVVETLFAGTPHEMMTMYTLDNGTIVATHYCAAGNQPTLRYDAAKSSPDKLVFDFVSVRGEHAKDAPYMSGAEYRINGDTVDSAWTSSAGPSHEFHLTRAK